MIQKITEDTALKFKNLSAEDKEKKGILGRLYGPVASFKSPTRNGRKYTQDLWEKLFESPLIKERFENGGIFGQLCHPDYEEVDMEKIACVMPEPPKKNDNGDLIAYVDIINTPCGKIAYQLAKYGIRFGISSRGTGDLVPGIDGDEVDPDTYNLTAFDLVEIPAVKEARLTFTESLDKTRYNKSLRQTLTEQLEAASEPDRKIMEDALKDLDIDLEEKQELEQVGEEEENTFADPADTDDKVQEEPLKEFIIDSVESSNIFLDDISTKLDLLYNFVDENQGSLVSEEELIDKLNSVINKFTSILDIISPKEEVIDVEPQEEVVDDMSDEVTAELQEALLKIKELEKDNLLLQEKLSVSNAKEVQIGEEIIKYKNAMISLSESAKRANDLNDKVEQLTESLNKKDKLLVSNRSKLDEMLEIRAQSNIKLEEANSRIISLEDELTSLNEKLENVNKNLNSYKETTTKLSKALKESKDLYLQTKAESYGLTVEDVKSKLTESYSIKDVNSVCEQLSDQARNLRALPFSYNGKVTITEAKTSGDYIANDLVNTDDEISDTLLNLIK